MRFLHEEFEPLRAHFAARQPDIRRREWDLNPVVRSALLAFSMKPKRRPAERPRAGSVDEIEAAFRRADNPELAGTILSEYFHVDAPPSDRAVSLPAAVEHVEAFGGPNEFLLVGYPDGGLISVSRYPLAFQEGLPEASWWAPETRWP